MNWLIMIYWINNWLDSHNMLSGILYGGCITRFLQVKPKLSQLHWSLVCGLPCMYLITLSFKSWRLIQDGMVGPESLTELLWALKSIMALVMHGKHLLKLRKVVDIIVEHGIHKLQCKPTKQTKIHGGWVLTAYFILGPKGKPVCFRLTWSSLIINCYFIPALLNRETSTKHDFPGTLSCCTVNLRQSISYSSFTTIIINRLACWLVSS